LHMVMPEPLRSLRALGLAVNLRKPIRGASDWLWTVGRRGAAVAASSQSPVGCCGRGRGGQWQRISQCRWWAREWGEGWRSPDGNQRRDGGGRIASLAVAHHKHRNVY
jgi:hypothetical protein